MVGDNKIKFSEAQNMGFGKPDIAAREMQWRIILMSENSTNSSGFRSLIASMSNIKNGGSELEKEVKNIKYSRNGFEMLAFMGALERIIERKLIIVNDEVIKRLAYQDRDKIIQMLQCDLISFAQRKHVIIHGMKEFIIKIAEPSFDVLAANRIENNNNNNDINNDTRRYEVINPMSTLYKTVRAAFGAVSISQQNDNVLYFPNGKCKAFNLAGHPAFTDIQKCLCMLHEHIENTHGCGWCGFDDHKITECDPFRIYFNCARSISGTRPIKSWKSDDYKYFSKYDNKGNNRYNNNNNNRYNNNNSRYDRYNRYDRRDSYNRGNSYFRNDDYNRNNDYNNDNNSYSNRNHGGSNGRGRGRSARKTGGNGSSSSMPTDSEKQ